MPKDAGGSSLSESSIKQPLLCNGGNEDNGGAGSSLGVDTSREDSFGDSFGGGSRGDRSVSAGQHKQVISSVNTEFKSLFEQCAEAEDKASLQVVYDTGGQDFSSNFAKYCYTCFHFLALTVSLLKTVGGTMGFLFTKMEYFEKVPYSSGARLQDSRFWLAVLCACIASSSQFALGFDSYIRKVRPKTSLYKDVRDMDGVSGSSSSNNSKKKCFFEALVIGTTFLGAASNCIWTPMFLTYYADFPNKTGGDSFDFYYTDGWWRFSLSILVSLLSTTGYYFAYKQMTRDFITSFKDVKNICSSGGAERAGVVGQDKGDQSKLDEVLLSGAVEIYNNLISNQLVAGDNLVGEWKLVGDADVHSVFIKVQDLLRAVFGSYCTRTFRVEKVYAEKPFPQKIMQDYILSGYWLECLRHSGFGQNCCVKKLSWVILFMLGALLKYAGLWQNFDVIQRITNSFADLSSLPSWLHIGLTVLQFVVGAIAVIPFAGLNQKAFDDLFKLSPHKISYHLQFAGPGGSFSVQAQEVNVAENTYITKKNCSSWFSNLVACFLVCLCALPVILSVEVTMNTNMLEKVFGWKGSGGYWAVWGVFVLTSQLFAQITTKPFNVYPFFSKVLRSAFCGFSDTRGDSTLRVQRLATLAKISEILIRVIHQLDVLSTKSRGQSCNLLWPSTVQTDGYITHTHSVNNNISVLTDEIEFRVGRLSGSNSSSGSSSSANVVGVVDEPIAVV